VKSASCSSRRKFVARVREVRTGGRRPAAGVDAAENHAQAVAALNYAAGVLEGSRPASRHVPATGCQRRPTSGDLDEQVAQPDAKRLEFRRETIGVYVGPIQLLGYLLAGPEQKDQC
jgi:hypothetical protein